MEKNTQIVLFSDANFLALNILKRLLRDGGVVNIISDDNKEWTKKTETFDRRTNILITPIKSFKKVYGFSHALFLGGFIKKSGAINEFKKFISNNNFGKANTLAIFPIETYSAELINKISIGKTGGVVYVVDLLGEGIDLNSDLFLSSLIKKMIRSNSLTLGIGELFDPLSVKSAAEYIVDGINSGNLVNKTTVLSGPIVSSSIFWKENAKHIKGLKVVYDTNRTTRSFPIESKIKRLQSNFANLLSDSYEGLITLKVVDKKANKIKLPVSKKNKSNNKFFKHARKVILFLVILLVIPFVTSLASTGVLFLSYQQLKAENVNNSVNFAVIAKNLFVIGKYESRVLAKIPYFGRIYKESEYYSYIGENASDVFINISPILKDFKNVVVGVLGSEDINIETSSIQIKNGIDFLDRQVGETSDRTHSDAGNNVLLAKQIQNTIDFEKIKNLLEQGSILIDSLPNILGTKIDKTYLVLFQNNMELRPAGGFIGSYGTLNFGNGKLNKLNINDIYSADGQLKGHIEPPEPIKKYLNEANWYFRDSNWSPNFTTSAMRAEWFLYKEMDERVDGTIAIDLTPIKNILNYTGPIFLPDYNLTITSENLYEKTQQESQANFFPGSRKKASFLTALSRSLLNQIIDMKPSQQVGIIKSLYSGLESRSIQIYFHDPPLQAAIDKLNWGGGVPYYQCGDSCYSDFYGEVEANVGVNKSNYFITRKHNFDVLIDKKQISRTLSVSLANSANTGLGPSGQYKTYVRVLIPSAAKLEYVTLKNGNSDEKLLPDILQAEGRQEVGVYIQVLPGEEKEVIFNWSTDLEGINIKSYGLYIRKQAGTGNDLLNLKLTSTPTIISSHPILGLTKEGVYTYNTNLSKDFFARVSFK